MWCFFYICCLTAQTVPLCGIASANLRSLSKPQFLAVSYLHEGAVLLQGFLQCIPLKGLLSPFPLSFLKMMSELWTLQSHLTSKKEEAAREEKKLSQVAEWKSWLAPTSCIDSVQVFRWTHGGRGQGQGHNYESCRSRKLLETSCWYPDPFHNKWIVAFMHIQY